MSTDDVLKTHSKYETTGEAQMLTKEGEDLITAWTYPEVTLIIRSNTVQQIILTETSE